MECVTYSLKGDSINSDNYYDEVEKISLKIIKEVVNKSEKILNDYTKFIYDEWVEDQRSSEEYAIELLYIGIAVEEYIEEARAFKEKSLVPYNILNKVRKVGCMRQSADKIRGKLETKTLLKKENFIGSVTVEDLGNLIKWMKAVGDFSEEVYRLNNWYLFLKKQDKKYIKRFFELCDDIAVEFYNSSKKCIGKYTKNVAEFLKGYEVKYRNREDVIYCGKSEMQYFFNMISSEVMNKIYHERFTKCSEKIMFVPACMKQEINKCLSEKTEYGDKCIGCSQKCNVKSLSKLGERYNYKVYAIEHETSLFNEDDDENDNIGVIGVACVLNLMSGGWKALRLGFVPQCVVLDFPGCTAHWRDSKIMTSINYNKLFRIIE